jgi:glycerate kinase
VRVVIAPDKFKGSLSAAEVASALARGLKKGVMSDVELTLVPVADGGDGTVDAAVWAGFERISVPSVGPTGEPVLASYAARGPRAVVELADVVGLGKLPEGRFDPLGASTYGLGVVMRDAIDRGAHQVVLGVGGSASTDGGAGMVQALGARLLDSSGSEVGRGGAALADVVSLDPTGLEDETGPTHILVASDVDNPLLGPRGATRIFGPQKGAGAPELERLESALTTWAAVVAKACGHDYSGVAGAGAAGGTAFAAVALLGAELRPGIDVMLEIVGFAEAVAGADLVVTGEGSLDEQSLAGKAPVGVATAAQAAGVPVVAVCGRCELDAEQLGRAGIAAAYPLSDLEPDAPRSMADAASLVTRVGEQIAEQWLVRRETR